MLFRTGRRISELLELKPEDVDFDNQLITFKVLKKKNKNFRKEFATDREVILMLKAYIQVKDIHTGEYIFYSGRYGKKAHLHRVVVDKYIKELGKLVGLEYVGNKKIHAHVFRHSSAIHLVNKGIDLRTVQEHLAHDNLGMTAHYLQFNKQDTKKKLDSAFVNEDVSEEEN